MIETEKDFSTWIEDLLDQYNWEWCHFRTARTKDSWRTAISGKKGFPDYIAVREARLLIFEIKSEKGKLSDSQDEWIELLKATQRAFITEPLSIQGRVASIKLDREFRVILAPEIYVWRPSQREKIEQKLRRDNVENRAT